MIAVCAFQKPVRELHPLKPAVTGFSVRVLSCDVCGSGFSNPVSGYQKPSPAASAGKNRTACLIRLYSVVKVLFRPGFHILLCFPFDVYILPRTPKKYPEKKLRTPAVLKFVRGANR